MSSINIIQVRSRRYIKSAPLLQLHHVTAKNPQPFIINIVTVQLNLYSKHSKFWACDFSVWITVPLKTHRSNKALCQMQQLRFFSLNSAVLACNRSLYWVYNQKLFCLPLCRFFPASGGCSVRWNRKIKNMEK